MDGRCEGVESECLSLMCGEVAVGCLGFLSLELCFFNLCYCDSVES